MIDTKQTYDTMPLLLGYAGIAQLGELEIAKAFKLLPSERPEQGLRRAGFPARQEPSC